MDFDYYQIRGKWNAATLNRRAEKLDEAQAAADELEAAGAKSVEIIGIKAGRRETIRGKKATTPTKTTKAKKELSKKTAVKMTGITGSPFITDYKTHEKAVAAAKNIELLGFETELVEPVKQLDLFAVDKNKTVILKFTERELETLRHVYRELLDNGVRLTNYKTLSTTFIKAHHRERIELSKKEITQIVAALDKYIQRHNSDSDGYMFVVRDLRGTFIKVYYNV